MSDPLRTETSRTAEPTSRAEREAKIEQLLLAGLDHYFAGQYDQAINIWTRALFLDRRICLFAMYFRPSLLEIRKWSYTIQASFTAPNRSKQSYFGIYPFEWKPGWEKIFEILRNDGKLLVAPILQSLILTRAPQSTLDWVNRVAEWDFQTIIPCHLDAPIAATPTEFRQAFAFLQTPSNSTLPDADVRLIREIDRQLVKWWIIKPSQKL